MTNKLEEIMKKAIQEEKNDFKIIYYPLGKEEIDRINSVIIEGGEEFVLPIEAITDKNSLIYEQIYALRKHKNGEIRKFLQVNYGTSDSGNLEFLKKIVDFNERVALKLDCYLIRVEMFGEKIASIYSNKEMNFFQKNIQVSDIKD